MDARAGLAVLANGKPADLTREREFRRTELEVTAPGIRPKSVFQLVGGGQVGPASLYGMQALHELAQRDFGIWPFEDARGPLVIEIFPRTLTGAVIKSSAEARNVFLRNHDLAPEYRDAAVRSEDAFDTLISALRMSEEAASLEDLKADAQYALEGKIWAGSPRAPRLSGPSEESPPEAHEGLLPTVRVPAGPLGSNKEIEDAAIEWVIEQERKAGRIAQDTRDGGAAGDIESSGRVIEVKAAGGSNRGQDLWLEPRQVREAFRNPNFYVYVVENVRQGDSQLFTLKILGGQRLRRLLARARERHYYEVPWPVAEYEGAPTSVHGE